MKPYNLMKASALSLALIGMPAMLWAQGEPVPETPATPDIPMPPGSPNPLPSPVEVPAPPTTPDLPPEHVASLVASPAAQNAYPPCTATLQDQCTNTRPEADVKATRPNKIPTHRHHLNR